MLWWILGAICSLLVVVALLFLAIHMIRSSRHEADVRENGEPVVGFIVQANNVLWQKGYGDNAAQILITFDRELADDPEQMLKLARRLGKLKSKPPRDDMEEEIAQLVIDETARFSTRYRLPKKFTGGPTVYSIAVMIYRRFLPDRRITLPYVYCVGLPGDDGGAVYMTEYPDDYDGRPPARRRRHRD
ncbi:MAG TPA: hypothetical protein VHR66_23055 [Gemmataceae bacterium]|jgi:hypothetical protein|nr:hypothetical protein [Gemmataceae bacterium]